MTARPGGLIHVHVSMHAVELPNLSVLRFAGPDAIAFLQGQVSNDTRRLADGVPLLAAYSTAQGRVIAVMHLLPHSSGVLAILPRDIATPTLERLRKFVLRAKVKIEELGWSVAGAPAMASELARIPSFNREARYLEHDGVAVARVPDGGRSESPRFWILSPVPSQTAAAESPAQDAWRLEDIRAGLPQVYAATSEQFVAQMLNLDRLDAISFTKGCYTGQEIIARTQHLGRIKRRMYRLRLPPGNWRVGQPVRLEDRRSGRLTELAPVDGGFEALAVLTLEAGGAADTDAGEAIPAEELPLPYSVQLPSDQA